MNNAVHGVGVYRGIQDVLNSLTGKVLGGGIAHVDGRVHLKAGQLQIAPGPDALLGVHDAAAVVVGDDGAVKAPLVAQHPGEQVIVAPCPSTADAVEGGHDRHDSGNLHRFLGVGLGGRVVLLNLDGGGSPLLNAGLEGFEVDFPDGLLVGEGGHMAAVVLLVV